jgi:hypothetical protein
VPCLVVVVGTATAQAHREALSATAAALPTPAPDRIVSLASGRVVAITAAARDGALIVTIELITIDKSTAAYYSSIKACA